MQCLVTGGAGFIGSNIALALENKGHDVIVLDSFDSGHISNLRGFQGEVIMADVHDFEKHSSNADAIFHQAAITGVVNPKDGSLVREELIMEVNLNASKRIFDFCKRRNIPLIYASSAATYGLATSPLKENHAGKPISSYGMAKWLFDKFVMEQKTENLVVGLRYFNVFGPRERYKGKLASMVWQLMQQMCAGERPRIFKFGEQARDQVYIKDVLNSVMLSMKAKENCIVNVGSGEAVTFNRMVAALNDALGMHFEPEYIENPYEKVYQTCTKSDLTMAKEKIGYEPEWKFESAVKNYVLEEMTC